ncbi:LuxS/MPP-like metallohydrolase [Mytilinidion resinicola]|uniref:LuxS/MPP-like metallohydrolase n=1 Tax=Mytilinidion resinicola TaxID=574789 RepID=A0A6A6Z6I0_9PEZI|nr:LuxS/MPP-like metallohydrolase [Mytilinidion resinicola]KAF2816319.1 LuxS/MPP-like metallohydrolase [Mytilinidion resinicola]
MAEPINNRTAQPERLTENLERPTLDDRSYRVIRLANHLEALLIHDPDTDKVSGALDVNVGSFSDAEDMPGIAHAVEHLLFMGTEKYPKENAYNQYLTSHSGHSNAYTAATSTNYYFEVGASSKTSSSNATSTSDTPEDLTALKAESPLYGALDRFAQFFVAPLFLEETLDRELKAVDSENKKNLQNDTWRLHQLNKSLSNPKHPYNHFSTGSYKTLHDEPLARGVKIRNEFMKFYHTHYSANRMKLVVLGRESLDDLENWVEELFSAVPNKNLPRLRWDDVAPYTEKELGMQIFAKPVFEMRNLELDFLYQDEEELYESQPGRYFSHLIGHEGPGSILAYIKAKGWANGLSAGAQPLCPGSAIFVVRVKLTEEGLKHYKEVTKTIFQYIAMMRESPPQEWIVDEMKRMSEVDFKYKQKSPASRTTSLLSGIMQRPYPRELLLSGPSLIRKFNAEAINKAATYLRPDNFRLTLISQDFPGDWDQKEKWYGTEYKYEKIPEDFLAEIKEVVASPTNGRPAELHLPHKNEFIPNRLEVEKKEVEEPLKTPKLIRNDENVRTWFKKDDQFWVPKASVLIILRSPLVSLTPLNTVVSHLYRELVYDALVEYSYDAEISGLNYSVAAHAPGLDVSVSGYNDKMAVLLEKVLVSMRDLEVSEDRFNIIKERLARSFRNWEYQQPYHQVGVFSRWLTTEKGWINEQLLAELHSVTAADVRAFFPQLLAQVHIELLAHGNIYKEDALKLTDMVESILKPKKLPSSQWRIRRSLLLPPGCNFVYERDLRDPANVNHCIEYMLYIGDPLNRQRKAKLLLMAQMADEPAFDQLRTKEQLGYVVFSGPTILNMWAGYRILIQSEKSPDYLEGRIDAFLTQFGQMLHDMKDEDFEGHKRSIINKRLEKLKNLSQETNRFWNHVLSECYDFESADRDVEHLTPLTKKDIIEFFDQFISPTSPTRAKLAVHMLAQSSPAAEKNEQMVKLVSELLTANKVAVKDDDLQTHFQAVEKPAKQDDLVEALSSYLGELKLEADVVTKVVEQGKAALAAALAETESQKEVVEADGETHVKLGNGTTPVVIRDVHAWKAGLEVSKGARPVQDLSDFEEIEAKL